MGKIAVFSRHFVASKKAELGISDNTFILTGTDTPTITPKTAPKGSMYLQLLATGGHRAYLKKDSGNTTNWEMLTKSIT